MKSLNEFYEIIDNPGKYAKSLQSKGKKIIGYFCSYTPEEIILAAGAHPMRLFGSNRNITLADAHLQAYSCSFVRSALEEALSGGLDFLYGTVFPHTCDSIQRLSDIWRLNTNFRFFADVVFPVKLNTESAADYTADVLKKFIRDLEKNLDAEITDEKLKDAIQKYNRIRNSLKTIYEMRSVNPDIISGRDLYAVVRGSMIMDRDHLINRLDELIKDLKRNKPQDKKNRAKRIILSGSICSQPDIYSMIEESGAEVVWDDLCTGSRYFQGIIEDGDPVVSLAKRYLERINCPAKHRSLTARGENILDIVKKNNADGVIFILLKFCDPHAFDYPYIKAFLEKEKIPSLLLEIEHIPSQAQMQTRLETFIHTLNS